MNPEDWQVLEMLPPGPNHDPFHHYVTIDGRLTPKALALLKFSEAIRERASVVSYEYGKKYGPSVPRS